MPEHQRAPMDRCLLWARASGLGSIAFGLGVSGHVSANGLLPGPVLLLVFLLLSVLASAPLLKRPAWGIRLVAMLVARPDPGPPRPDGDGGSRRRHRSRIRCPAPGSAELLARGRRTPHRLTAGCLPVRRRRPVSHPDRAVTHLVNDISAHAPMMAAHLAAAALVGLWLAHGERCLWTLLALTGRRLRAADWASLPALVEPQEASGTRHLTPAVPSCWWQARPPSRRGPPALSV